MERCLIHDAHSLPEAVAQVSQALASWEGLWDGSGERMLFERLGEMGVLCFGGFSELKSEF